MRLLSPSRHAKAAHLLHAATDRTNYPTASFVPAYWYDGEVNFGDLVTPAVLRSEGYVTLCTAPRMARVAGAGSIIEFLGPEFSGVIWGSGKMHENRPTRLPRARVLGVRGPLTRSLLNLPESVPLGDPGLLLARSYGLTAPLVGPVGLIPHNYHKRSQHFDSLKATDDVVVIDAARDPLLVARDIARCRAVVSTSLHGLIFADALGVPACWGQIGTGLPGGDFKFRDYLSTVEHSVYARRVAIDHSLTPRLIDQVAALPSAEMLASTLHQLDSSHRELTETLPALAERVFPPLLPLALLRRA